MTVQCWWCHQALDSGRCRVLWAAAGRLVVCKDESQCHDRRVKGKEDSEHAQDNCQDNDAEIDVWEWEGGS